MIDFKFISITKIANGYIVKVDPNTIGENYTTTFIFINMKAVTLFLDGMCEDKVKENTNDK